MVYLDNVFGCWKKDLSESVVGYKPLLIDITDWSFIGELLGLMLIRYKHDPAIIQQYKPSYFKCSERPDEANCLRRKPKFKDESK